MNFSHGSYEYHQSVIDHAREAERQFPGRPLAIALDTVSLALLGGVGTRADIRIERTRDPHWKHQGR